MTADLLSVEDLTVEYRTSNGTLTAVDRVTFSVKRGESLAIVGESGSGKSSIALALLRLLPENGRITNGTVKLDGVDLTSVGAKDLPKLRGNKISLVFQAAMSSLDPVYRVGDQIVEAIQQHADVPIREARQKVEELFAMVEVDHDYASRFPHELSGGMRQRVVIAMALACDPDILIADEPTTALDVVVQGRIVNRLREIQTSLGMAMVYITHDMGIVSQTADVLAVMYAGEIVEMVEIERAFSSPMHPYTRALIESLPRVTGPKIELKPLEAAPPDLMNLPEGCRFEPRCPIATDICRTQKPQRAEREGQWALCWHPLS